MVMIKRWSVCVCLRLCSKQHKVGHGQPSKIFDRKCLNTEECDWDANQRNCGKWSQLPDRFSDEDPVNWYHLISTMCHQLKLNQCIFRFWSLKQHRWECALQLFAAVWAEDTKPKIPTEKDKHTSFANSDDTCLTWYKVIIKDIMTLTISLYILHLKLVIGYILVVK